MLKTALAEIKWPPILAPHAASLLAMQYQFEQTQWQSAEELRSKQLLQLSAVLDHAYKTIPFYCDSLSNAGVKLGGHLTEEQWLQIPVLTRKAIQDVGEGLVSRQIPSTHGQTAKISTSGSTGRTINVLGTGVTSFYWQAFTLRDHLWHRRNFSGKLAAIKYIHGNRALPPNGERINGWGPATDYIYDMGPSVALSVTSTVDQQLDWLRKENPHYLLTYPSVLFALAEQIQTRGLKLPNLCELRTLGELVTPETRELSEEIFGVPLVDMYSCQEAGYLALQCPERYNYHVQSENVLLEILDENDKPCGEGEVGRVVISTLNNFATPLIRYDVGDYAEFGASCVCGRGLPVLKGIKGRVRNMLTLPSREQLWPQMGTNEFSKIAPIRQFQFVQKNLQDIDVKFVVERPLTEDEEAQLTQLIQTKLTYPFNLNFIYLDNIPRSKGGKFEDFISEV